MKTKSLCCGALLLAFSTFATVTVAESKTPTAPPTPEAPVKLPRTITGVVFEKTDKEMRVRREDGQGDLTVILVESVLITNGEVPGTLKDLVPGVRVEVKVKDDTNEATSIKILGTVS